MIKKYGSALCLFAVACLMSVGAEAKPRFGARIGANFSTLIILPLGTDTTLELLPEPTGAFVVQLPLGAHFALQPELGISINGTKEKYSFDNPIMPGEVIHVKSVTTIPTVDIPVLARFMLGGGKTKFLLDIGPQFGIVLDGKSVSEDDSGSSSGETHFKDQLNTLDGALILGTGVQAGLGKGALIVDLRLKVGLTNLRKQDPDMIIPVTMSTFGETLSVSYLFN